MASEIAKFPEQEQDTQPGKQSAKEINLEKGKVALVTGGDSGIGRAICYYFALEGASVAFTYVEGIEDKDTNDTLALICKAKSHNASDPLAIPSDLKYEENCEKVVNEVVKYFGHIDVLVNNAAVQFCALSIEDITEEQLRTTFETNIFAYFFMTRHSLKHMKKGSSIINTASQAAYKGNKTAIDYSSTKGVIVSFTRSLALQLIKRGIRVNGVAPGPIWTPLQVAKGSLPKGGIPNFGSKTPFGRPGQPYELAPSYVFLASNDCSSYMSGQVLHPNGGTIVNG
ncbi:hypothetical protein RND81_14G069600 [Saponaria officinalis]|uniref:Uncharacterized protein n=1 Tax=Saponaria officinalis TaxID=3572 RepID=A0AAW1GIM8_SAPOF